MALKFIDYPSYINPEDYEDLKDKIIADFKSVSGIKSIYQMGSVKHPGISDLDVICVFENNSKCDIDYRANLSTHEKSILTHGFFGIEEKYFEKSIIYNLVSNLKLLYGEDLLKERVSIGQDEVINTQIAFEYLVKMFITIDAQLKFGIVKLRAFLLLAKAIIFDLELLQVNEGKLYYIVNKVIEYRSIWFKESIPEDTMSQLIVDFHKELKTFLKTELSEKKFYLPKPLINLPLNFSIVKSESFNVQHTGLVLPNQFSFLGKKYINLQNRLNKFEYRLPYNVPEDGLNFERFKFSRKLIEINKSSYTHFIPLTTSLSIY